MSQSEIDNLNKFISENSMNFKGDIFKLFDLLNSDMSIDDFKQKILEQKENLNNPTKNTNNKETSEEDKKSHLNLYKRKVQAKPIKMIIK